MWNGAAPASDSTHTSPIRGAAKLCGLSSCKAHHIVTKRAYRISRIGLCIYSTLCLDVMLMTPNAELRGWLVRRREVTPLDSPLERRYSYSVLLSVILITAGRYLSAIAGHAPADYESATRNTAMFTNLASSPRVRLDCLTNTQGSPFASSLYCLRRQSRPACPCLPL